MRAARHCEAEPVAGRAAACAEDWSRGHGWCGPAGGCAQVAGRAPGGNYRWRPVEAGQASAEPQRARTRARRRAADQHRRRWTQRALTGPSGPTATSRHARPGQAAGPARRSVGRRATRDAGGRPGSRPGGVRWWSGCVGRSVPDGGDGARASSPEAGLRSCRLVEEAAPVAVDLRARVGRRAVGSGGQTWWATGAGWAPPRQSPRAASCAQAAARTNPLVEQAASPPGS